MKPDMSGGSLDWLTILNQAPNGSLWIDEALGERVYSPDGTTYTRSKNSGIVYGPDGNDVNTTSAVIKGTPEQAVRALEAVWGRLNDEPLTENDEYNEGWNDAMHLLRQEIDALKGIHTPDRQTP